jgi:hypothetical protein
VEIKMQSFWSRRRISSRQLRPFAKFLSRESLRKVQEAGNEFPPLQKESLHYLLLQVRDDKAEDIPQHLSRAIDTILAEDNAFVETTISSIVLVVFRSAPNVAARPIDELLKRLGPNVRAVYGRGEYLHGGFGSANRFIYGTIFPNFSDVLTALFRSEFGSSMEIQ